MIDLSLKFCPNELCSDFSIRNKGNISIRGTYGKNKQKQLLYCRTCGKRFSDTRSTAFFGLHITEEQVRQIIHHAAEGVGVRATARLLNLDKDTVNRAILRAGEHCSRVISGLLQSLHLSEVQLDELWAFVKKRKLLQKKN